MDTTINCPKCGSPKVRMSNPENLCEKPYESPYVFDAVATTGAICDDCGHKCSVDGHITWQQPRAVPKPKDVKYLITFELDADADPKDFMDNIHNSLLFSANVTSKSVIGEIKLVVSES
jgi:DNA-directed RNA polymerase subunit RPC12/RpoP